MNKQELRERTRLISGFEMDGLRSNAEIDDVNNDTYLAICDVEEWPFLLAEDSFSTVQGTAKYDLEADLAKNIEDPRTITIEDAGGTDYPVPLEQVTQRWIDRAVDEDATGTPTLYARPDDTGLVLAPTPDKVYTVQVRGFLTAAPLSANTDEPIFAERFHPMICYFAAATLLDEEGRFEESKRMERRGSQFLDRMHDKYLSSADDTPIVMGSRSRARVTRAPNQLWRR